MTSLIIVNCIKQTLVTYNLCKRIIVVVCNLYFALLNWKEQTNNTTTTNVESTPTSVIIIYHRKRWLDATLEEVITQSLVIWDWE